MRKRKREEEREERTRSQKNRKDGKWEKEEKRLMGLWEYSRSRGGGEVLTAPGQTESLSIVEQSASGSLSLSMYGSLKSFFINVRTKRRQLILERNDG